MSIKFSALQFASNLLVPTFKEALRKAKGIKEFDLQPLMVRVDRATAQELWNGRIQNRQIKPPRVVAYAKMMSTGDALGGWRTAGVWENPVKITSEGKLAAGQHRMLAFLKTGLPEVIFAISFNASEVARQLQDSNINRSKLDCLDMFYADPGWINIQKTLRMSAAKNLWLLHEASDWTKWPDMKSNLEFDVAAKVIKSYENDFQAFNDRMPSKPMRGHILLKSQVAAAFIFARSRMAPAKWESMFDEVYNGSQDTQSAPFKMEQIWVVQATDSSEARWRQLMQCLGCLKAHEDGTADQLDVDTGSPYPVSYEAPELQKFWSGKKLFNPFI